LAQLSLFVFVLSALANDPKALLLVDEPELSLHPQSQRALVTALRALPNQSLVATHSSNILDRADARTIVRLYRAKTNVAAARASALTSPEAERLARFVSTQTSEACFGRKVVLVEGYSDRVAILRLAMRLGRDLDAEGVTVISLDGGAGITSHLQLFGKKGLALEILGLCDEDKEAHWQRELQKAQVPAADRATMKASGFFVCVKDLEQELIRALGLAEVQAVIAQEGQAVAFTSFSSQPAHIGKPVDEQLRAFLHRDNTTWVIPLVNALDLKAIPGPLHDLINHI